MGENYKKKYNELVSAIRRGDDLLRLIGPTEEENRLAEGRLAMIDVIDKKCDWGNICPTHEQQMARECRERVAREQDEFEGKYC